MFPMLLHLHLRVVTVLMVMQAMSPVTTVAAAAQRPITLPGCPDKCGNISIPYPFGVKEGCYFDMTFSIACNLSTTPPAMFYAPLVLQAIGNYFEGQQNLEGIRPNMDGTTNELLDIDIARAEVRVTVPISSDCSMNESYHELNFSSITSPSISISSTKNVLVGIGQRFSALIDGETSATNYSASCNSLFDTPETAQNGACMGLGCCEAELAPGLDSIRVWMYKQSSNSMWKTFPCSYSMAVEKSWYNFSLQDLYGYGALERKFPRGVPLVLDFAIRNDSCPADGMTLPTACRSDNSRCVNATYGPGYLCKCKDGFDGNPYIPNGCQDINECELRDEQPALRDQYRCYGICMNTIGGYDCRCKFGTEGDAKTGTCTPMFPLAAMVATVGIIGVTFIMVTVLLFKLLFEERRKTKEFFVKNGGPILEKVDNIKMFKKEELKPIIQSCNVIGKGGFGEVYKGLLDNKLVAIKKSINVDKLQEKQFTNEIIIQSKVIHKNIIKLVGCCLEVDIPMLVYEFVPRGSLHDILHGSTKECLPLQKRLNIAAGAAEGLAYMHSKTSTTILHGDIKPGNILLDDNFDPKISDFGISRLIAIDKTHTKCVIGDMCYMDPVYLQSGLLTNKSDVYSFGVVLLELLTRQKASSSEDTRLVKRFLDAYTEDHKGAIDLFDREILLEGNTEVFHNLAILVVECLKFEVETRPEMTDVEERLQTMKRSYVPKSISDASSSIDT
uniref:Protein kinase domain-containing protein n=1 Tax=Oryza rufipogon TaxID=4529 RepID=A0A0E0QWW2_ORYRU